MMSEHKIANRLRKALTAESTLECVKDVLTRIELGLFDDFAQCPNDDGEAMRSIHAGLTVVRAIRIHLQADAQDKPMAEQELQAVKEAKYDD